MFNPYLLNAKKNITISLSPPTWFLVCGYAGLGPTLPVETDTQTEIWLPDGVTRSFSRLSTRVWPTHVNVLDNVEDGRALSSGRVDKITKLCMDVVLSMNVYKPILYTRIKTT